MNKLIFIYLGIINLTGFFIMLIDKSRAIHHEWRVSEKTLFTISIIGGSIGMLLGMSHFRHKTKHKRFTIGIPLIIFLQLLLSWYLIMK